jgi:hypothetical protein
VNVDLLRHSFTKTLAAGVIEDYIDILALDFGEF